MANQPCRWMGPKINIIPGGCGCSPILVRGSDNSAQKSGMNKPNLLDTQQCRVTALQCNNVNVSFVVQTNSVVYTHTHTHICIQPSLNFSNRPNTGRITIIRNCIKVDATLLDANVEQVAQIVSLTLHNCKK